jgi:hypothetical protein
MKILFIARHYTYLRLFESAIEALAARGHRITLAADRDESMGGRGMVARIAARYPGVTLADAPSRHAGGWPELARRIRLGLGYLRYLDPLYRETPHLRRRAEERAPRLIVALAGSRLAALFGGAPGLTRLLRALEAAVRPPRIVEDFLRAEAPDVMLVTPLVEMGSPQTDYLVAAHALGIPTVFPVASWDHLSSKALLRAMPDRVLVWNESQRTEAEALHGVPPDRIVVTGAQCFDQWFDRAPSRSREAFCARVGLRADAPYVLYVCSSLFRGTADEPAFVERWIRAIRSSADPRLRDLGILVRPHPARVDELHRLTALDIRNVAVWGAHPVDDEAKDDYFDSMYYSAGVVGLNTSAFIEAAVVGKPVHTVLIDEISRDNQEGTLHFRYLREVGGGLLYASCSLDEHVRELAATLAREGGGDPRAAAFLAGFVRPFGLRAPATPRFVEAVEGAVSLPPAEPGGRATALAARAALTPVAALFALYLRLRPRVTRAAHRLRKWRDRQRILLQRRVKQFAVERLGAPGKRPKPSATQVGPSALTPKAGHRRDPAKRLTGTELRESREAREMVTVLGRSGKPIILGPWLSETGFELLYWIPFLAWAKAYGHFDPDRLVAVSRGGAAGWYRDITPHYEEIFSLVTPDEFRTANERRIREQGGRQKHVEVTSFDREIVARVRERRGLRDAELLHPSLMYAAFDNFWYQKAPVTLIEAFTRYSTIPPADPTGVRAALPARYVAAKFYGNVALPDTPANRAFVAGYLADLARQVDVVLLNTAQQFDEHLDFPPSVLGRLHRIDHLMRPETNLAVQTEVIRHADGFVGTYGGFSYLAPLCGVDTIAFYSHSHGFRFDHLEVAKRVFSGLQCGTFVELDLRAVEVLRLGFGRAPGVGDGAGAVVGR